MTFWLILGAAIALGLAACWWLAGRAKPGQGPMDDDIAVRKGKDGQRNTSLGNGGGFTLRP